MLKLHCLLRVAYAWKTCLAFSRQLHFQYDSSNKIGNKIKWKQKLVMSVICKAQIISSLTNVTKIQNTISSVHISLALVKGLITRKTILIYYQKKSFEMSVDEGLTNGNACSHQIISPNSVIYWSLMPDRSANRNRTIKSFICQKTLNHKTHHQDSSYLRCCVAVRSNPEVCMTNKWIHGNTSFYLYWHL